MPYQGCPCFWLEPTGKVRISLRRFSYGLTGGDEPDKAHRACPAQQSEGGYRRGCDASTKLDLELPLSTYTDSEGWLLMREVPKSKRPPARDPRWPKACSACGKPFRRGDQRQVNQEEVYVRSDTGEKVAFRGYADKSMAGALLDCWWLHGAQGDHHGIQTPDGIVLVAICPNGAAWMVDGEASGGGRWTRTGDPRNPPTLSVTPSIVAGDYHGFLTNGAFTDG